MDAEYGGVFNCVRDDGELVSTEKFLWSQGRMLWLLSVLHNHGDRSQSWYQWAEPLSCFLIQHGRNQSGEWYFSLKADGSPQQPPQSVYVDGFCMYGLTEFARAWGSEEALEVALRSYRHVSPKLDDHSSLNTLPHPIPTGFQAHGPLMLFALVFHELGTLAKDEEILTRALELADRILEQHWDADTGILHEFVRPGGTKDASDPGQTFIPGHVIEGMWFLERIYRFHQDNRRIAQLMEIMRHHLELGWDPEFGGIYLACHQHGGPPTWHNPQSKIWWPHTEGLQGLLLAYSVTKEDWARDWYWRVHDYAFAHFPNWEQGDWFHNLDRKGQPTAPYLQTLPVKDPFHLPRALLYSLPILKQLET